MVCWASCRSPAGRPQLSQVGPALFPLHSRGNTDPGPRRLSESQGHLVAKCSHRHLTCPHCMPAPWWGLPRAHPPPSLYRHPNPCRHKRERGRGFPSPCSWVTCPSSTITAQPDFTQGKTGPRQLPGPLPTQTWMARQGHTGLGRCVVSFSRRQHILDLAHAAASHIKG